MDQDRVSPSPADVQEESRRVRSVRLMVDLASNLIMQGNISRAEGEALVTAVRARILDLFPDREETYELLYATRFARLLDEFTSDHPPGPGRPAIIVPFPARS